MIENDLKTLQKAMRKARRIATEKAGELHDLVEDRLPADYKDIPKVAEETYRACEAWSKAEAAFKSAESELA